MTGEEREDREILRLRCAPLRMTEKEREHRKDALPARSGGERFRRGRRMAKRACCKMQISLSFRTSVATLVWESVVSKKETDCHGSSRSLAMTELGILQQARPCAVFLLFALVCCSLYSVRLSRCRATCTPLAEAWERECVTPEQSPITKSPLLRVSRFRSISTSML